MVFLKSHPGNNALTRSVSAQVSKYTERNTSRLRMVIWILRAEEVAWWT